jgi:hypothetical protein
LPVEEEEKRVHQPHEALLAQILNMKPM